MTKRTLYEVRCSFNKVQKKVKIEPKGDKSKDAKGGRKFWVEGVHG